MTHETNQPRIGEVADPTHTGRCCYALEAGNPFCLADATWHGYVADERGEPVAGLESCDAHKPIMDQLATWVHQHDSPCGLPDALFYPDLNLCMVPWVEAEMTMTASEPIGVQP